MKETSRFCDDNLDGIEIKKAEMNWIVRGTEEAIAYRIKAEDEKAAVRIWYKSDLDEDSMIDDAAIDDAFELGNLDIVVIKESDIINLEA